MTIIVCILHLIAAEFVPAQRSKGDMLRYNKHKSKLAKSSSADDETANSITFAQDRQMVHVPSAKPKEGFSEKIDHGIIRQSSVLNWQDLTYDVKVKGGKKTILHGINGWVKPGTLTALMVCEAQHQTSLTSMLKKLGCYWGREDNFARRSSR